MTCIPHLLPDHGIALPLEEVLFKNASAVLIRDGIDHLHDLGFQVHQAVDIFVDLISPS